MNKTSSSSQGFSILKFLLGLVAIFIVGILVFLTFFLSPTAKWAANSQLPGILGTDASVENIKINLWKGDIEVTGVQVADPSGDPEKPKLFSLGRLFIDIDTGSLFKDTIVIREVTVESPEVHTSRDKNGKFSFEDLKVMQPSDEEKPPEEPSEGGFGKAIQVDKITVSQLAGSFSDASDPKALNQYSIKDFNFHSGEITVNPEQTVADLPAGVNFALIQLSDAIIEYQTNKDIADPDQPVAKDTSSKKSKKEKKKKEKTAPATADATPTVATKTMAAPTPKTAKTKTPDSETEPIYIGEFSLKNFKIHYLDTPKDKKKKPLDVTLLDFYVTADDIGFDPDGLLKKVQDEVVSAKLGFEIEQKQDKIGNAIFSGVAKSTIIGDGLPVTAGAIQLTGFELSTVKSVVPTGVQSAIGGPAFDLYTKWFASPDKLTGEIKITSSSNVVTKIEIGGTPTQPRINGGKALLNVIGRPGQLIGNLAGNTFKGGMDIVSGATGAAGDLAKGAGDTVLGFGKGLLNTGKGLMKGNLKEAGQGLQEATVGTVKTASGAVGKSATTAVSGVGNAYDSTTGGARTNDWRLSNSKRHAEFQKGAEEWLQNGKFPPDSKAPAIKSDTETFNTPADTGEGSSDTTDAATQNSAKSKDSKKQKKQSKGKATNKKSGATSAGSTTTDDTTAATETPESSTDE